jgi:O-antigen/teichoic acid export membrane protein
MKHFAWSFINTLLTKGFSFIFSIVLGNLLLPGDLGIFVTVVLILAYVVSIFSINLGSGIVQKLNDSNEKSYRNHYFSAGFITMLLLAIIASIVFLSSRPFLISIFDIAGAGKVLTMIALLVPVNMLREFSNRVLQADMKFRKLTVLNTLSVIVQLVVTIILVSNGEGLKGVIYGLYSGGLVGLLLVLPGLFRKYKLVLDKETISASVRLIKFSSLIHLGSIAILLDQRIDVLFVSHYLDSESVAVYNYALKFTLIFLLFGNSISRVTFPKLTKAFSLNSSTDVNRIFGYSLDFSFIALSIAALLFLFNANFIIDALLPSYYIKSVPFLLILLIGIIPKAVVSSVGTMFTAKGIPSVSARVNWLMLGVNIVLNFLLIPRWGLYGAAIATSTSFFIRPFFVFYLLIKHLNLTYALQRIIVGFVLFWAVLILGSQIENIFIKELLIVGYILYCVFLFLRKEEKSYLLQGVSQLNLGFISLKK